MLRKPFAFILAASCATSAFAQGATPAPAQRPATDATPSSAPLTPADQQNWQDFRRDNRYLFARGTFNAPFPRQHFHPGTVVSMQYYDVKYLISDSDQYHLPRPAAGTAYYRHYDDVLLINIATGRIVKVIEGFFW